TCAIDVFDTNTMMNNSTKRLTCKVLLKNLRSKINVETMRGFRVIKDLLVDQEQFFEKYKQVKPYLINDSLTPERERPQTPAERERYEDTTKCILCGACTTSCPSFWANPD